MAHGICSGTGRVVKVIVERPCAPPNHGGSIFVHGRAVGRVRPVGRCSGLGGMFERHRIPSRLSASSRCASHNAVDLTRTGRPPRECSTFATIAAPITATSTWRRNNITSGNSTCVIAQPRHRARHGVNHRSPDPPRSTRLRRRPLSQIYPTLCRNPDGPSEKQFHAAKRCEVSGAPGVEPPHRRDAKTGSTASCSKASSSPN